MALKLKSNQIIELLGDFDNLNIVSSSNYKNQSVIEVIN